MKSLDKDKITDRAGGGRGVLFRFLAPTLFYVFLICWYEFMFHLTVNGSVGKYILLALLFAVPVGIFFGIVTGLIKSALWQAVCGFALSLVFFVWFGAQFVYYRIFDGYFTMSQFDVAGDAMTDFHVSVRIAIIESLPALLLIGAPLILAAAWTVICAILAARGKKSGKPCRMPGLWCGERTPWLTQLILLGALIMFQLFATLLLPAFGKEAHTPYDLYYKNWELGLSVKKLGVFTATRLELQGMIFGDNRRLEDDLPSFSSDLSSAPSNPTEGQAAESNLLDIDFEYLIANETDQKLLAMHRYFSSQQPTGKNEYTGMFEGYNLIYICAESFSSCAIYDQTLFPTLYKLTHSGFVFNNFYTGYSSNTTHGEYSMCTGLLPDTSRKKTAGSFLASAENELPYCLGNVLGGEGYTTYAYHDHSASYYSRNLTHPNMGYSVFKARNQGLKVTGWPESDVAMMEQTVDDYINDPQFHAYYMTVSGHHNYSFADVNDIADKNEFRVAYLEDELSEAARAYLACNLELEDALTYLIDRLEQAGVLDKTVIVLGPDHYPYGLRDEQQYELMDGKIDRAFGRYESSLIIWNNQIPTVEVDKYCCTIDILPTVLNLFGVEYDSRLLSGKDILSDSDGLVIFNNKSFINDIVKYDSTEETVKMQPGAELPAGYATKEEYAAYMIGQIETKFDFAAAILNTDYYRVIFYDDGSLKTYVGSDVSYQPGSSLPGASDSSPAQSQADSPAA